MDEHRADSQSGRTFDAKDEGFHAKDGWHFQRTPDGGVTIHLTPKDMTLEEVTLDADTWCSVVAAVTRAGETAETFRRAKFLHEAY